MLVEPGIYFPLTEDNLRTSNLGRPIVCKTEHGFMEFGVLGEVNDLGFQLYADVACKYPSHRYDFEQVRNREVLPIVMIPKMNEVKQR